ncbi:MAG: MotA/TolQ/ExbB proton channel family protein [Kiritimatiellae bacterium]|jgi:biopolymer transport protein ExbB|nr:MotA/TolQ/ExbB proton channel family protein [Kiritimatiellia bacterium]
MKFPYCTRLVPILFALCVIGTGPQLTAQESDVPATVPVSVEEADTATEPLVLPGIELIERFKQGGFTMWVLLGLSFIMVTFGSERLFNLRRSKVVPDDLADNARAAWKTGDKSKVVAVADAQPSVLASAIKLLAAHSHLSANDIATMAGDDISRMMRRHLQRAYPLAIVATLSPLLGLLGTVTGMIDAFEVVAIAGSLGDASLLAAGIAKALVTTAFGLIVAIPALGLYHHFRGKTHDLNLNVEEDVDRLIIEWFHPRNPEAPVSPAE